MGSNVALVARESHLRMALARAFEGAPPGWMVSLHEEPPPTADVTVSVSDHPGAVRFDPEHPEAAVEEVACRLIDKVPAFLVTSASGGTGATTVGLHLAAAFAHLGRAACFLDLDTEWGVRTRLGLEENVVRWSMEGGRDARASSVPLSGGFRVLLPPERWDGTGKRTIVESARLAFERVVIDAPRSDLDGVIDLVDGSLLVTSASPTGAARARHLLDRYPSQRWAVLINRLGRGSELTREALSRLLGHAVTLELPCCPQVRDAEDVGKLATGGWTRWERRIAHLARALDRC